MNSDKIRVQVPWDNIVGKPENIDNCIYAVMSMCIAASGYESLIPSDTLSRVKEIVNNVVLSPCKKDYEALSESDRKNITYAFTQIFGK